MILHGTCEENCSAMSSYADGMDNNHDTSHVLIACMLSFQATVGVVMLLQYLSQVANRIHIGHQTI